MTISYQKFKGPDGLVLENYIKRLPDNAFIPFDPANTDYQAFLKYQAEGGKVYGADEEVPDGQAAE
jgi:hypothetical protein